MYNNNLILIRLEHPLEKWWEKKFFDEKFGVWVRELADRNCAEKLFNFLFYVLKNNQNKTQKQTKKFTGMCGWLDEPCNIIQKKSLNANCISFVIIIIITLLKSDEMKFLFKKQK